MRKAPVFCAVMAFLLAIAIGGALLPDRDKSELENRVLCSFPAFSWAGFQDGRWTDDLETYAADQLPLRDAFVSLHMASQALLGRQTMEGVILGGDGRLFDRTDGWKERNVLQNAGALHELADKTGLPVYLVAVPSAAAVYPEALPARAPVTDEEALLKAAGEKTPVIPLLAELTAAKESTSDPLFYRTDHHWTAAGARVGYLAVCEALGLEPQEEEAYQDYPGFFGSYYARFPLPWMRGDVFHSPLEDGLRLTVAGEEKDGILDEEAAKGRDKYAALLYGNHPVMELINADAPDQTLFVIKDSYANALLPALSRHYRRIVAVDARYFTQDIVETAKKSEGDAILCVYGLNGLSTGRAIALLEGL